MTLIFFRLSSQAPICKFNIYLRVSFGSIEKENDKEIEFHVPVKIIIKERIANYNKPNLSYRNLLMGRNNWAVMNYRKAAPCKHFLATTAFRVIVKRMGK